MTMKEGTIDIFFHDDARGKEILYDMRTALVEAGFMVGAMKSSDGKSVSISGEGVSVSEFFLDPVAIRICIPFHLAKEGFDSFLKRSKAGQKIGTMLATLVRENVTQEENYISGVVVQFYEHRGEGRARWWDFSFDALREDDIDIAVKKAFYALSLFRESLAAEYLERVERVIFVFAEDEKRWRVEETLERRAPAQPEVSEEAASEERKVRRKKKKERSMIVSSKTSVDQLPFKDLFALLFPQQMVFGLMNPIRDARLFFTFVPRMVAQGAMWEGVLVVGSLAAKWFVVTLLFLLIRPLF